jgi:hypothetical protein
VCLHGLDTKGGLLYVDLSSSFNSRGPLEAIRAGAAIALLLLMENDDSSAAVTCCTILNIPRSSFVACVRRTDDR